MYGPWQFGVMPLNQFVFKHNLFAEAMRKVDPIDHASGDRAPRPTR